jgi:peptide/nickel transport system permease protein
MTTERPVAQPLGQLADMSVQSLAPRRTRSRRSVLLSFCRRKPLAAFGAAVILVMVVAAAAAPLIATHDPGQTDPRAPLAMPSREHLMGTDRLGRDIFSRLLYGARVSVAVGFGAVAIAVLIATTIGTVSAYYGGVVDMTIQRFIDILISFPFLVALITVVSILPAPDDEISLGVVRLSEAAQTTVYIVVMLGVLLSLNASRVIRGAALTIKQEQYMLAARAIGVGDMRSILRYILPNIMPIILVLATSYLGAAIFIESAISFLGVGLPPSVPSWGRMLNEATASVRQSINVSVWPGLAIALVVYASNMFGDGLRDVLDPRLRGM